VKNNITSVSSIEGNEYTIEFSPFAKENVPGNVKLIITDINLKFVGNIKQVNNAGTLNMISSGIFDVLKSDKNMALYFYCDNTDIDRRNQSISPQKYRSLLFSKMFERFLLIRKRNDYIDEPIILIGKDEVEHYIHIISHKDNECQINILKTEIKKMENK
jgi:hypothetical protein